MKSLLLFDNNLNQSFIMFENAAKTKQFQTAKTKLFQTFV